MPRKKSTIVEKIKKTVTKKTVEPKVEFSQLTKKQRMEARRGFAK